MSETQPKNLSPYEVVLQAFKYFKVAEMDEASLVRICLVNNCPTEPMAKAVLLQMVERRFLTRSINAQGVAMYSPVNSANQIIKSHLN